MYFFLLGVASCLGQAALLREIVTLSYGNEFFYTLGLAAWLLLVASGSFLATILPPPPLFLLYFFLLLSFFLPSAIILFLRELVIHLILPGQLLSLPQAILLLMVGFFFLSPLLGWLFTAAQKKKKAPLSQAYFQETLGFFLAGSLFSLFLVQTSFPLPPSWNRKTLKKLYPSLEKVSYSPYQAIIKTKKNHLLAFWLNGQPAFDNEDPSSQLIAGLILSFLPQKGTALLAGHPHLAATLSLSPLIKEGKFIELDPLLLKEEKDLLTDKIKPLRGDLKNYLEEKSASFSLIALALSPPNSLLSSRWWSLEFFQTARQSLTPNNSLMALIFPFPVNYQGPEALRLGRSLFQTFQTAFPHTTLLFEGDQLILLGSNRPLTPNPKNISLLEETYPLFTSAYFNYHFHQPERKLLEKKLSQPPEKINRQLFPIAFFYQTLFWQTLFSFQLPDLLFRFRLLPPLLLFLFLLFLEKKSQNPFLPLALLSSFLLITVQSLLLFLFQLKFGSLFQQVAWLFSLVLLGIALGVKKGKNSSLPLLLLFFLYFLLLLLLALSFKLISFIPFWWLWAFFLGVNGGLIFGRLTSLSSSPLLYSADLIGAFLGALFTNLFLLPLFGFWGLAFFLLFILLFLFTAKHLQF